jgi:hypothetical protein
MTQDEIIEMARQSGMDYLQYISPEAFEKVEAFAKLVAQHEREACEALCKWRTGVQQVDAAIDTCAAAIRVRP